MELRPAVPIQEVLVLGSRDNPVSQEIFIFGLLRQERRLLQRKGFGDAAR